MRGIGRWVTLLCVLALTVSCGPSGSNPQDLTPVSPDLVMPGVDAGPLDSIGISPSQLLLKPDSTVEFSAAGLDANGTRIPGLVFTWESSDTGVASIDQTTGIATGIAMGTTTITAKTEGESGTATLAVSTVATIQVIPLEGRTVPGGEVLFTAVARDSRGLQLPGGTFAWASSNPEIAAISPEGSTAEVTGISLGETQIVASADGVTSRSAPLTVTTASSIEILPKVLNLARGSMQ